MEYAGFKKAEGGPVRWGEIATKITGDLAKVDLARKAQREVIQKQFTDASDNLDDIPHGQNKGFNQFVIEGADGQRNFQKWLAKAVQDGGYDDPSNPGKRIKLNPSDATKMLQNAKQDWSNFAREAKNYNENFAEMMKRQQGKDGKPAPAGAFELFLGSDKADLSDLRNKKIISDPTTGRMSLETYDTNGNVIDTKSLNSINNNQNQLADRVDVSGMISNQFKNAGEFQIWDGDKLVASQQERDDYAVFKTDMKNTILGNARNKFSVLADNDNGKFTAYKGDKTGDDYKKKMTSLRDQLIEESKTAGGYTDANGTFVKGTMPSTVADQVAEGYMVETETDELGNVQPKLSAEQDKRADEYVDKLIDAQAGYKETAPQKDSGTGTTEENLDKLSNTIYQDSIDAVNNFNFSRFNKNYEYEETSDGNIIVWEKDKKGNLVVREEIQNGDHKALSQYHNNIKKIDAARYDAAQAGSSHKPPTYTQPAAIPKAQTSKVNSLVSLDSGDTTDIKNIVTETLNTWMPGFKESMLGLGTAKINDKYSQWDLTGKENIYEIPIIIDNTTVGTIIVDSPSETYGDAEDWQDHNNETMKAAMRQYRKNAQKTQTTTTTAGGTGGGGATSGGGAATPPRRSDIALKEDINLVGQSPNGINIYEFKYINKEGRYRGVMAQEVPWASIKQKDGYLAVDYSKIDVDFEKI